MRVLMINRADARVVSGGDVIQMEKTRAGLASLGIRVDVRLTDELDGSWDYDLVHIFNIQSPGQSWEACQLAKDKGLPVALSPIYWDLTELWYWTNPQLNPVWRLLKSVSGRRGYPIYRQWQRFRSQAYESWRLQRQLLLAADIILPNSRLEQGQIRKDFALSADARKFAIVPNAIDRGLFERPVAAGQTTELPNDLNDFVLEVGRISPEKNCLALIESLWEAPVPIVFVGKASPYMPEYAANCRERGQQRGNVHFLDWVSHERLPDVYRRAAVHALPSWRETPGLVSLEAAACGCRIVSTSIGSAREYFGADAWYCHPAYKASIRRAVMQALEAPPLTRLRNHVLNNFTWDKAAESTLRAYKSLLRGMDP